MPCLASSAAKVRLSPASAAFGSEPQSATIALNVSAEACRNGVQSGTDGAYRPALW